MASIRTSLANVKAWMEENAPARLANLAPGATSKTLDAAEKKLGFALPASLRQLWSAHDGQKEYETDSRFFGDFDFFSVYGAQSEREWILGYVHSLREKPAAWTEAGVKRSEITSDAWLPFAQADSQFLIMHAKSGRVFLCEKDWPPLRRHSESLAEWLDVRVEVELELGKYSEQSRLNEFEPSAEHIAALERAAVQPTPTTESIEATDEALTQKTREVLSTLTPREELILLRRFIGEVVRGPEYFELKTKRSSKFWEVTLRVFEEYSQVATRYGAVGKPEKTTEERFPLTGKDAQTRFDALIEKKRAEGYRSATAPSE